MSDAGNNQRVELTNEERFKQTLDKIRPYIITLRAARNKFLIFNGIILVLTLTYLLFLAKPYYDTSVTILPDYGTNASSFLSQFSGIASLAGVNVGQSNPMQIYQSLVTSEAVLEPVIYKKYKTNEFADSVNLIEYDEYKPDKSLQPGLQKRKLFLKELEKLLKSRISVDLDRFTQILTIRVKMPEGQLSADVANNIAASLDIYIQSQIRTSAKDQRKYIEKRISQVKDSLTLAENNMKEFNERNMIVAQSPSLLLEQARLQRRAEFLNTVYMQLAQQAEIAKVQEVKDTPVINIEEAAQNPIIKSGPSIISNLIIILSLSIIVSGSYFIYENTIKKYLKLFKF